VIEENGNTVRAITQALEYLNDKGTEITLIHLTENQIKPCKNCNMECYYNREYLFHTIPKTGEASPRW
jgi:multimeric flavodoxin WrbA